MMTTGEIIATVVGSSALFSFIEYLITRHDNKKNNAYVTTTALAPIKHALMALLQFRLEAIMTASLRDGVISANTLKNVNNLYSAYVGLGGNDYIHTLYEQVKELPIE